MDEYDDARMNLATLEIARLYGTRDLTMEWAQFSRGYEGDRVSQEQAELRARGRQERHSAERLLVKAGGYPLPEDWSPRGVVGGR